MPDLPHDEAGEVRAACDAEGLALVPLVAPTSTPERIAEIGAGARGFVYTVSLTGTTGERSELAPGLVDTVARVRAATEAPVAVGFGISTPDQARTVAEHRRRRRGRKPARARRRRGRRGGGGRARRGVARRCASGALTAERQL